MSDNYAQKGGIRVRDLVKTNKNGANTIPIPSSPFSADNQCSEIDPTEVNNSPKLPQAAQPKTDIFSTSPVEGVTFVPADFVTRLFSNSVRYENSKKTVLIDQEFKNMLDTLSQISKTDVSQILNNILNHFLGMESKYSIVSELHKYIQKQQQSITQNFKPNNRR